MGFPRLLPVLAALSVTMLACSSAPSAQDTTAADATTSAADTPSSTAVAAGAGCETGEALVTALSTRDKLAQLLMVGITSADDARAVVTDYHVGGVFYASWTDPAALGEPLIQIANDSPGPVALSVSVDEEGGRVSRLAEQIGSQPSARVLGSGEYTADDVYAMALDRGTKMRDLGITLDFAPVADVSGQPDDSVIGDRSFSDDPQRVIEYAGAYARGLRDAGMLPVLKHFPGHGSATGDSHYGGVSTPPLEVLKADDLLPYGALIPQGRTAVMVGHMVVPGLTDGVQASLSPAAYAMLRDGSYGGPPFNGVVFTDDLSSMQAVSDTYPVPDAVLLALQAGADVALWVSTDEVPAVLDRLETAVESNELPIEAVNAKLLRWAAEKGSNPRCGG